VALDQCRDQTVVAPHDQIAFPVAGHRTILYRGRSLADRYRVGDPEPASDLPRRLLQLQLTRHDARQRAILHQFTGLWSVRPIPGGLIGATGPITSPATVTVDLSTHRRRRSTQ
jgi:hypothetical protein